MRIIRVHKKSRGQFRGRPYPRGQQNTRGQQQQQNTIFNTQKECYKCGNQLGQNDLQSCPAKYKICSKCGKRVHFAKVCCTGNASYRGDRNNEEQQGEIATESQETYNDPVVFTEFTSKDGWDEYQFDKFSVMAISEAFEMKNTASLSDDDLNGHIVKLKTKTEELFAIANSGSPVSFLNRKTARRLEENSKPALFKRIPLLLKIWHVTMAKQSSQKED